MITSGAAPAPAEEPERTTWLLRQALSADLRSSCLLFSLAALAEHDLDRPFIGAADDAQLESAAACHRQRVEQVIDRVYRLAPGRHDQVPLGQAGACGRAAFRHIPDKHPLGIGEAHGAPEPPGHVPGSDCDTKLRLRRGLTTGKRIGAAAERLVGRYGQIEALAEAVGVDSEQLSAGVQDRAARGSGQERSGVLDAAGNAAATRAAEGPLDAGDEPVRHAQPTPARVGQAEDRCSDAGRRAGRPRERRRPAGVDVYDREVPVDVASRYGPLGRASVGEGDHYLIAAHIVRVGQHPPLAEHDARADAPALPDADDRGTGTLRQLPNASLYLVEDCHRRRASLVGSDLQVTTYYHLHVKMTARIGVWPNGNTPRRRLPRR